MPIKFTVVQDAKEAANLNPKRDFVQLELPELLEKQ